jgi:hypothetical protein
MSITPYHVRQILLNRIPSLSDEDIEILLDIFMTLH